MRQGTRDLADSVVSRSVGRQTESLSERFEVAWRSADSADCRPRIQDYLGTIPESERSAAFRTLLAAELKCRLRDGEQPTADDYYSLFPEDAHLIQSVFEETGQRVPDGQPTVDYSPAGGQDAGPPRAHRVNGDWSEAAASAETQEKLAEAADSAKSRLPSVPGYEVLRELGRGGMGIVYEARDLRLRRLVALKMMRPGRDYSHGTLERLLAEARAVAKFKHAHLVQIYDIAEHAQPPYLSLELLEGGSLKQQLAGTPQPPAAAAALLETLARAVDYAHQQGIIHRDLKPANILLAADGTAKVADFGLAKQIDEGANAKEEGVVGTPSYMAPEQAWGKGSEVGPRADVYALGAILYEMLTGRPPFKAADRWQTMLLVRTQEPIPPRQLVPQVPRDLELICLKCLHKASSQRFTSARELAEELRRFQEGRPIHTRPAPLWERAWKWGRRQPALASLVVVSVVALLSFVLYLDQRARAANRLRDESARIGQMREQVLALRFQAQEAVDLGNLSGAQGFVHKAFGITHAEPSLTDLEPPLATLAAKLAAWATAQKERQAADDNYRAFFHAHEKALFHGMVFTGVDLPVNAALTKQHCQEALAIYGVIFAPTAGPEGRQPGKEGPVFPRFLSAEQRRKCLTAGYELLVVWAEAEAQPEPGRQAPSAAQLDEAIQLLDRAARLDLPATQAFYLRRAHYLELQGKAGEADAARRRAAETRPGGALDYFLTGVSHQTQGRLAEATNAFLKALDAEPNHFWARYFLGVCYLQRLQPAHARNSFTACLGTKQDYPWLYLMLGLAHGRMDEFNAAEQDFAQALKLLEDQPNRQAQYGILVNQAALRLRQARLVEGVFPLAWLRRGEKLSAAKEFLQQAVALLPDQYPAYRYLALIAQEQDHLHEAAEQLGQALQRAAHLSPSIVAQLYGLRARVHHKRHAPDAALADLDRALAAFPTPEDHAERGRILHEQDRYFDALLEYQAALRLGPDKAEFYRGYAAALFALHRQPVHPCLVAGGVGLLCGPSRQGPLLLTSALPTGRSREIEAVAALDQYLATGGQPRADVFRDRGRLRVRLHQLPLAVADYTEALRLQPDSATYAARGWVFLTNEVLPLALQDFDQALRLDPENAEAHAGRGLIHARRGQQAAAIADAEAALATGRPDTAQLFWNVAHIYAQLAGRLSAQTKGRTTQAVVLRATDYRHQAVTLLRRALGQVRAAGQAAFWKENVSQDVFLEPLRGDPEFDRLERHYGK